MNFRVGAWIIPIQKSSSSYRSSIYRVHWIDCTKSNTNPDLGKKFEMYLRGVTLSQDLNSWFPFIGSRDKRVLGSVVQRWVSANPGLKFNSLF